MNFVDNVITSVEVEQNSANEDRIRYSLFVYTAGIIAEGQKFLSVVGQCGEGYYGDGFRLEVEIAE